MRISDWSSDVCSSDLWQAKASALRLSRRDFALLPLWFAHPRLALWPEGRDKHAPDCGGVEELCPERRRTHWSHIAKASTISMRRSSSCWLNGSRSPRPSGVTRQATARSEEHTSELQSLMRISYAVFCLKKKKN